MEAGVTWYVRKVLSLLNESEAELEAAVVYGDMGMELRRLIAELLPSAARKVMLEVSHDRIDEVKMLSGIMERDATGVVELEVTPNFLRLVELRMSDWEESIYAWREPVSGSGEGDGEPDSGEWLAHHPEKFPQEPGNKAALHKRPAAMLAFKGSGRVIRIWGTGLESHAVTMAYLPEPEVLNDRLWVPKSIVQDVVAECAQMVKAVVRG